MSNTSTTGYTLVKATTPFVDGNALLHIIIASVAAGCGLAVAFGLILLGSEYIQIGKTAAAKLSGWTLGLLATAFCLAAVGVGVYVMVNPPKSKPLKVIPKASTASSLAPSPGLFPTV